MTDDEARAVAEVAKTTGEIVRAAGGLGSYLAKVFGSIPEDTLGLIGGDWLSHKRRRHLAVLGDNTVRFLEGIDTERLTEPSPRVLIPLLEAAIDEGRAELQDLWATLLANAMVDGGRRVRRDYFDAVRQMEPSDAVALDIVCRSQYRGSATDDEALQAMEFMRRERQTRGLTEDDWEIGLTKLEALRCITEIPGHGFPLPAITAFGRGLIHACQPPASAPAEGTPRT